METGQLVYIHYHQADDTEDKWEYGVVTHLFDDRSFVTTPSRFLTVFQYTSDSSPEKDLLLQAGIVVDELERDNQPVILSPKGFLKKYYVLPDRNRIYL